MVTMVLAQGNPGGMGLAAVHGEPGRAGVGREADKMVVRASALARVLRRRGQRQR